MTGAGSASPDLGDVEPVANETRDRIITGFVTGLPVVSLVFVGWQAWGGWLHWRDVAIFVAMYVLTGLGVTVGFHRLFTHRSFKTTPAVRATLAILGSAAIEGPITSWVADHRKHHVFSDQPGDPHSPHVDHGHGLKGALRGLFHAHMGWLFIHTHRGNKRRYAPDLLRDPLIAFIDRTFLLWAALSLVLPMALGGVLGGSWEAALTGLLWGGFVRMLVVHHVTYSINSLCHFFGRRDYVTEDESRNLAWLAPLSFGEAWHNNHHAFPRSARHGMKWWEVDISAIFIWSL
ncbi:MAG TPA: fatty acid desaturase, partial [Capillimicrobium sp.]|nr:fatty acid desaturase [Capillimicrobium sp.]